MNTYAAQLKEIIHSLITEIAKHPGKFITTNPNAFTRSSQWNLSSIMNFILGFGSNSLGYEIGDFFQYKEGFPTVSAFVQQRKKLSYTAFEHLFHSFNRKSINAPKLFKGYRLLAIDGSEIKVPKQADEEQDLNLYMHGLFDVLGKVYIDTITEKHSEKNEPGRACDMVDRIDDKYPAIIIADRGYEGYNFFAHIEAKLLDYVVRIKDINSNGILSGIALPEEKEFDITRRIFIHRSHDLRTKMMPCKHKYLAKNKRFDYGNSESDGYEMIIRFVRFKLTDSTYECLATSLSKELFSVNDLKKIYQKRWGIETGFRELKHIMGMSAFHSKQENSILQEVYARLIMYNYSMLITGRIQIKKKNLKNELQINYTQAIRICQHYFRQLDFNVLYDIETTIQRFLLPVRPHRSYKRTTQETNIKNFNYRLA